MVGERLKNLRLERNLTQEELAKLFGCKKSTICTYEKENRTPPHKRLKKYVEFFGVSVEYLMGIDNLSVKEDSEGFKYFSITDNEKEFVKLLRNEKDIHNILMSNPKRGVDLIKRKIG